MRARGLAVLLAGWISISGLVLPALAAGPAPRDVEIALQKTGPRITLETYFSCEKYEGSAYEGIASGSPAWLALAERMLAYSDACYTEGIQAALGEAMRKSPRSVLRLVDKSPILAANYICLPFISSEQPIEAQLKEIAASRKIIQGVRARTLLAQKTACLRFIRGLETDLKAQQAATAK